MLAMIAFASNSLLCRAALRETPIDAATFTTLRMVSGALVLAAIVRLRRPAAPLGGSWTSAAALFGYAIFFSFAYLSLTAATGALLLFGAVQATMIGWGVARGERLAALRNAYCRACYAADHAADLTSPIRAGSDRVPQPNANASGCRQAAPGLPHLSPLGRVGAIRGHPAGSLCGPVASVRVPSDRAAEAPVVRALRPPGRSVRGIHGRDVTVR